MEFSKVLYETLVCWSGLILFLVWAASLVSHLASWAKAFVNDKRYSPPKWSPVEDYFDSGLDTFLAHLLGLCGVIVGAMVWPITWPAIAFWLVLLAIRKFVRFKKSYLSHVHDKKTGRITEER